MDEETAQRQIISGLRSRVAELEGDEKWARTRVAQLEAAALDVIKASAFDLDAQSTVVPVELLQRLERLLSPLTR